VAQRTLEDSPMKKVEKIAPKNEGGIESVEKYFQEGSRVW